MKSHKKKISFIYLIVVLVLLFITVLFYQSITIFFASLIILIIAYLYIMYINELSEKEYIIINKKITNKNIKKFEKKITSKYIIIEEKEEENLLFKRYKHKNILKDNYISFITIDNTSDKNVKKIIEYANRNTYRYSHVNHSIFIITSDKINNDEIKARYNCPFDEIPYRYHNCGIINFIIYNYKKNEIEVKDIKYDGSIISLLKFYIKINIIFNQIKRIINKMNWCYQHMLM